MELDELCEICGHPFNPHVLVATMKTAELGGLIFCDQPGCPCQSTWSLQDEPEPYIPDDGEIEKLRELVQPDE